MTGTLNHDPFVMAFVLAIASALLSIEDPQLESLTVTLVALAIASRLVRLRSPSFGSGRPREELAAISLVAIAAALYLLGPVPIGAARGPVLAISLLPLWWISRQPTRDPGSPA